MSEIEIRKLPRKTIIIIGILIILSIAGFLLIKITKEDKMQNVLNSFGYKNVSDITVYNVSPVLDEKTNREGELYKISFTNNDTKQECKALIFQISGRFEKDIECK